jgi:hypothetical protein
VEKDECSPGAEGSTSKLMGALGLPCDISDASICTGMVGGEGEVKQESCKLVACYFMFKVALSAERVLLQNGVGVSSYCPSTRHFWWHISTQAHGTFEMCSPPQCLCCCLACLLRHLSVGRPW